MAILKRLDTGDGGCYVTDLTAAGFFRLVPEQLETGAVGELESCETREVLTAEFPHPAPFVSKLLEVH
jgi:hypothetical protein